MIFTDEEKANLVGRLLMVLEKAKAGKATARKELAEMLTNATNEFLTDLVLTKDKPASDNKTGIWQLGKDWADKDH